jgi:hypothetical protein
MLIKLLLVVAAAFGGQPLDNPRDKNPPPETEDKDYFCCHDVDTANKSGEGCITIGKNQIDACSTVLACHEGFTKKDGVVTCT